MRIAVSIACWIGSSERLGAEAQIDHARPLIRRGEHAGDDVARLELGSRPECGVPRLQQRLRIDADHADVVGRCADERCDGRPVDPADGRRLLRVEGDDARAAGELLMRDIDTGVDDRDRLAGAWRGEADDADRRPPPFGADEGIGEVGCTVMVPATVSGVVKRRAWQALMRGSTRAAAWPSSR